MAALLGRTSRCVLLVKVAGKSTDDVVPALCKRVRRLPAELRNSITWDRGMEMARHKDFSVATDVQVYFCDPRSPWQRGSNENTNGLLRQYFPKGTDFGKVTKAQVDRMTRSMNNRPRRCLGYQTPHEVFEKLAGVALQI